MSGPKNTPYENGIFLLCMDMTDNYPFKPPKARFQTKVYHPNIKLDTGEICDQVFTNDWKPTMKLHDSKISSN